MSAIDLRCGRWEDVLGDVECDALICDPPYSERTATGFVGGNEGQTRGIEYGWIDDAWIRAFVASWAPRTRWWLVVFSDDVLAPSWRAAMGDAGLYTFASVPWAKTDPSPRYTGDGPASGAEWITVARQRRVLGDRSGSRPGSYVGPIDSNAKGDKIRRVGGKPLWLMRALVRDYSRPGDLICDPCAGGATTLLAAAIEGRRAVGAECDPATHELARKRIAGGYTPSFDFAEGT